MVLPREVFHMPNRHRSPQDHQEALRRDHAGDRNLYLEPSPTPSQRQRPRESRSWSPHQGGEEELPGVGPKGEAGRLRATDLLAPRLEDSSHAALTQVAVLSSLTLTPTL